MKFSALAIVLLPFNLVHALQVRAPVAINVTSVSLKGTGCPPSSFVVATTMRSDVTIIFDSFLQSPNSGTLNCSITLAVSSPSRQSFRLSLGEVDYRGAVSLEDGAKGSLSNRVSFPSGNSAQTLSGFAGPMPIDNYDILDKLSPAPTSGCGPSTSAIIEAVITVSGTTKGFLGVDSIDIPSSMMVATSC